MKQLPYLILLISVQELNKRNKLNCTLLTYFILVGAILTLEGAFPYHLNKSMSKRIPDFFINFCIVCCKLILKIYHCWCFLIVCQLICYDVIMMRRSFLSDISSNCSYSSFNWIEWDMIWGKLSWSLIGWLKVAPITTHMWPHGTFCDWKEDDKLWREQFSRK